ncbi:MAG: DUF354 domain-containing protein [Candidatus Aminicenantes bacterium]|jgi:predicted glycosyltransferase
MNILIDIGHPAHVHLFKNFYFEMKKKCSSLIVTVKNIPSAKQLLDIFGMDYIDIGSKPESIRGKLLAQFRFNWQLLNVVRKKKIDLGIGTSISLAHVSKISRMKSFVFDDDDSAVEPLFAKFCHPFVDFLISPNVLDYERRKKNHFTYAGYHELAYLHPNRFKPDPRVLKDLDMTAGTVFFVLRFNAFKAHHDVGIKGLSFEQKKELIKHLSKHGRVFITMEKELLPEFKKYQLTISPAKIHSLLFYATMFIGDSQTMTSEAAVSGTPALRCNSFVRRISYLEEEEHKYGLTYGFKPDEFSDMIRKIEELLAMSNLKGEWQKRREKMLADKIDVTAFMVWFIENYPDSVEMMKKDPTYQYRFK